MFRKCRSVLNGSIIIDHIGVVYDFTSSDEPISEWWWHLDQVADGKIAFNLKAERKD
ncbi:hypothetical protein MPH47_09740 [Psychrobacillus psychrodurans]|uniref:hypothetical protein n=1 Tax=Psychrobacillus psychrodurans TaxID=126157 RepID=UPI001F4EF0FF|nr:hypothetical protein [Psychrobacillus psychrodurans]MCK1997498.1 hypothetical protein [Psychrobacillus psychrodurans]